MRTTTYTQQTVATRASSVAIVLLVLTILQGTSSILTPIQHFAPQLQPIVTLIWFMLYIVAVAGLVFAHGLNWIFWVTRYRFLLIILLFGAVASIAWSIEPNVSTQRVVHLLGSSLIAIYLGFMIPLTTILTVFAWTLAFILTLSVISVLSVPALGIEDYAGEQVWRGITTSKNTLGFWAAIGVLVFYSQMARPSTLVIRAIYFTFAMFALFVLYKTNSATSVLALMVGGLVALYFFIAIRFQLGIVRMGLLAVLFTIVAALAIANTDTSELVGRSGDLTGRGEVWSQTWKLILEKPLTGYGYGSIWNPNESTLWIQQSLTDFTWTVYHAHNGFLQIASEIGIPLSVLALLMIIQQVIEIFYCQYDRQQIGVLFVLGFVVAYLISNYSEARFLVNRELYWIFFVALPISMLRQVDVVIAGEQDDFDGDDIAPSLRPKNDGATFDQFTAPGVRNSLPEAPKDELDELYERDHVENNENNDEQFKQLNQIDEYQRQRGFDRFEQSVETIDGDNHIVSVDIDLEDDLNADSKPK